MGNQKIALADMHVPLVDNFDHIKDADLVADGIHPNDDGYKKMVSI